MIGSNKEHDFVIWLWLQHFFVRNALRWYRRQAGKTDVLGFNNEVGDQGWLTSEEDQRAYKSLALWAKSPLICQNEWRNLAISKQRINLGNSFFVHPFLDEFFTLSHISHFSMKFTRYYIYIYISKLFLE